MMLFGRTVAVIDTATDPWFVASPERQSETTGMGGARSVLNVPFMKDGSTIGGIAFFRETSGEWPDRQVALLENFAAQAVIAMENARLLTETREALERQTATADVLQVINASPGNLAPVFDAILEKATLLCGAAFGFLVTWDGHVRHIVAARGLPPAMTEYAATHAAPTPGVLRVFETKRPVHVLDLMEDEGYRIGHPDFRAIVHLGGVRTALHIPLVKDDAAIGAVTVYRREVRPFPGREITLLENFASQAVIAMENARLIDEQREALDRQTAMADVLQIINATSDDLTPVFYAILEAVLRLSGSAFGSLWTFDGDFLHREAVIGYDDTHERFRLNPASRTWRLFHGGDDIDMSPDIRDTDDYRAGNPGTIRFADEYGARTQLIAVLRKDGKPIGDIVIFRKEIKPFTAAEVALVRDFAVQAVIAMENARLLNEQREALERQTATADILAVINASPGDLAPVFDTILNKGTRYAAS